MIRPELVALIRARQEALYAERQLRAALRSCLRAGLVDGAGRVMGGMSRSSMYRRVAVPGVDRRALRGVQL